jgi:hypothetical protein
MRRAASGWLRPSEIDAGALGGIVRRVERAHPGWRLDGCKGDGVHQRVAVHFATAQRRWQRERG